MELSRVVCFAFIAVVAAVQKKRTKGCSFTLTEESQSVNFPESNIETGDHFSCSWNIQPPDNNIVHVEINRFSDDIQCDCNCGRVLITEANIATPMVYCQKYLPSTVESNAKYLIIKFELSGTSVGPHMTQKPLFSYVIKPRSHRSIRAASSVKYADVSHARSNNSLVDAKEKEKAEPGEKFTRLPVIIPASVTVFIFVACVACIAYKNYNIEEFPFTGSSLDLTEKTPNSCCRKSRRSDAKSNGKSELYDDMLKQYKADTYRKHPSRKSSTLNVEGVRGTDPESIARKHLILRHMRDPGKGGAGAVGALIKMSSQAFMSGITKAEETDQSIPEEEHVHLLEEEETVAPIESLPVWQQEALSPDSIEDTSPNTLKTPETDEKRRSFVFSKENFSKKRNSGFRYKRLEKQAMVDNDSDEELEYDCAQHIQRILLASRENLEEARRILPDDVKDIVLPEDLEEALEEFELWPDSSV